MNWPLMISEVHIGLICLQRVAAQISVSFTRNMDLFYYEAQSEPTNSFSWSKATSIFKQKLTEN